MFLTFIMTAIRQHRRRRMDLHQLSQLTERDLQDIGITRCDLASKTRRPR